MRGATRTVLAVLLSGIGSAVLADVPDFLVEKIRSDGVGWIITDYFYKYTTSPRTSRVTLDFYDYSYGKGIAPGPMTTNTAPAVFGFWEASKGKPLSCCRWYSSYKQQIWGEGWQSFAANATQGDNTIEIDYVNRTARWHNQIVNSYATSETNSPYAYGIFTWNYNGTGGSPSVYDFRNFKIYETSDGGVTETLVRDFVPCCANGVAAIYDKVTGVVIYPTTTGFTIPMTNVTLAAGATLRISSGDYAPKSLALGEDCALMFDGAHTLSPETTVVLPAAGTITVSLEANTGLGRYTLIENLPSDYALSAFQLGTVPAGYTGALEKDGAKLMLVLADDGSRYYPQAFGETLTSDAHGHIDTEYRYKYTTPPRTSRVKIDFYTTTKAKGTEGDGPYTAATRVIFGFLQNGTSISYARITSPDDDPQMWGYNYDFLKKGSVASGDNTIEFDYINSTARWNTVSAALATCVSDATLTYWIYDWNAPGSGYSPCPSVFDLKNFSVYETSDGGTTETLVRDFVPCVDKNRAAIYDRVTCEVKYPAASTNGFVCGSPMWRLRLNSETLFKTAGTPIAYVASEATVPDGYLIVNELDDSVFARGSGSQVAFTMPSAALAVLWTRDGAVAADGTLPVASELRYNDLTLGAGATLAFGKDGLISVSGDLTLPAEGTVTVAYDGITGPGLYTLMRGLDENVDLTKFVGGTLVPQGYIATFARYGDKLVMRVAEDLAADTPGVRVASFTTDGSGYVDTGYYYKYSAYLKTSRIWFDCYLQNKGRVPGSSDAYRHSPFGYLSNGTSISYASIYNEWFQIWGGNSSSNYYYWTASAKNGRTVIELDYLGDKATFGTYSPTGIYPSETDASRSYYLFSCNGNASPAYLTFYGCRIYETPDGSSETLVRDFVPCVKNGKAQIYDAVTGNSLQPTNEAAGFTVDYGTVTQQFACAWTTCAGAPVTLPEFAPQNAYTFVADGTFTTRVAMDSVTIATYDAGGVLVTAVTENAVYPHTIFIVALDGAAKAVVTTAGESCAGSGTVGQSFAIADVAGGAESLARKVDKCSYEIMIAADATLTFRLNVESVIATAYDADGTETGTVTLSGYRRAGTSLDVDVGTAAYLILHIKEASPGTMVLVR